MLVERLFFAEQNALSLERMCGCVCVVVYVWFWIIIIICPRCSPFCNNNNNNEGSKSRGEIYTKHHSHFTPFGAESDSDPTASSAYPDRSQ